MCRWRLTIILDPGANCDSEGNSVHYKFCNTVSASAIAMGIALSSQAARAADPVQEAMGPGWYVSVFGGASFSRLQSGFNIFEYDIKMKDGFSVGAAIGRQLGNGFRAESELSYMRNAHKAFRFRNGSFSPDIMDGESAALFMMGNLWKDIRLSDTVQPYIGGGLGTAIFSSKEKNQIWKDTSVGLAAQAGVGVRVGLSDRVALDVGYRLRAVIDATLKSTDGADNGVFSYYSHTAQLGLDYALGEGSRAMPAESGDPSDWYVSLFAGAMQSKANWTYQDGSVFVVDQKKGFTVGGAIGTELAPGLRAELELSYARSALDSFVENTANGDLPASGHVDQGFLLANIWKDFDLGMVTPYIGGGIGFGLAKFDHADLFFRAPSDDTGYGFAGQFGLGARVALADDLSLDLGYRFKSIVDALIIGGNGFPSNSEIATTNHVVQLGLNYGLGAGSGDSSSSVVPGTTYVSLFGGAVLPLDTHASVDFHDYLVDFKTGFTVGAAVGANLTDNLRGELELAFQNYKVNNVEEQGNLTSNPGGKINSYFLMTNLWRDVDLGNGFKPYIGGGVGLGLMDVNIVYGNNHEVDGTNLGLAAQVGSGVRLDVTDNMTLDLGYRFKAVAAVATKGVDNDNNSSSYYTHVGQVGVAWKF
jgi:opacity protein-like surface antigen